MCHSWATVPRLRQQSTRLFSSNQDDDLRRISIAGASVSPEGFWAILQVSPDEYWPVQVTCSSQDEKAASSPESLTLLQLLSDVDMAGPILPPEVLAQLAVLHAERNENSKAKSLLEELKLPESTLYSELTSWQRSRIRLPKVTLDSIVVTPPNTWTLVCRNGLEFTLDEEDVEQVSYDYNPATSLAFTCLALALRYQAPMLLSSSSSDDLVSFSTLQQRFPLYRNLETLRKPGERVQTNLQRGFEVHKLTGALRVAMERGDEQAARLIREKLDEYDSMDDLPTIEYENTDLDQLQ